MAKRVWVALPGRDAAVEMTRAELEERRKRGDLPAGTRVCPFGQKAWQPLEALAAPTAEDLEGGRTSMEAPPPSASAAGFDPSDPVPELARTIATELPPPLEPHLEETTPALRRVQEEPRARSRWPIVVSALLLLVFGASAGVWAFLRFGYTRRAVLDHVPEGCAVFEYYDLDALDASSALRPLGDKRRKALRDWSEDLDDEDGFRRSDDEDARGRVAVLRLLEKSGLRAYGDVKEIAYCALPDDDKTEYLLVVGGTFRGKDLLDTLRQAFLHRDRRSKEDKLVLDESEGRPILKLGDPDKREIALVNGQIAMVGKHKIISRYFPSKPMARAYGVKDGDVLVRLWAGTEKKGPTEIRYRLEGDRLVLTTTWTPSGDSDGLKKTKEQLADTADKLRGLDGFEALGDAFGAAEVVEDGSELKSIVKIPLKDYGKVVKHLFEADRRELRKVTDLLRASKAQDPLRLVVQPGVDFFELKLSPWKL
ncbi:MAG: hypothetical protein JNL79_40360 [Myxococcales bacterium]|nr:hypothetical protein [Myxococcales bacterium]